MAGWDVVARDYAQNCWTIQCPFCGGYERVTDRALSEIPVLDEKPIHPCRCGQEPHLPSLRNAHGEKNKELTVYGAQRRPPRRRPVIEVMDADGLKESADRIAGTPGEADWLRELADVLRADGLA